MARGSRRPHVRRVRSKPIRRAPAKTGGGCAVLVAAASALPLAAAYLVWRVA